MFPVRPKMNNVEYASNTVMTFLDILGFKKMVEERPLSELKGLIEKFMDLDDSDKYGQMTKINTKYISDSLIVWMDLKNPKDITSYFVYLGSLIGRIHKYGHMYVRGCVAYGNHYNDEKIWISPVFIESYLGEQQADVPRIILLDDAIKAFNALCPGFTNSMWFEKDDAGVMYINYMNMISGAYKPEGDRIVALMNHSELAPSLLLHRDTLAKSLAKYPQHRKKYLWLADMHNKYIDTHIRLPEKDKYKVSVLAQQSGAPEPASPAR
jgi:hypothetical protein